MGFLHRAGQFTNSHALNKCESTNVYFREVADQEFEAAKASFPPEEVSGDDDDYDDDDNDDDNDVNNDDNASPKSTARPTSRRARPSASTGVWPSTWRSTRE